MHFIIDDQAPTALGQQFQMRERSFLVRTVGEHLISADRHIPWILALAGVFTDLAAVKRGLVLNFLHPLVHRRHIGGHHQGTGAQPLHDVHAHHGLARTAGQYNGAEAATGSQIPKQGIGGHLLIRSDGKRFAAEGFTPQGDRYIRSFDERHPVLDRVTDFDQLQFHLASCVRFQQEGVLILDHQQLGQRLALHQLGLDPLTVHEQPIIAGVVAFAQADFPPSRCNVLDVEQDAFGNGKPRPGLEPVYNRIRIETRGGRIPQGNGGECIGVHVFRALDQLTKADQIGTAGLTVLVMDIQQQGLVTLYDQGGVLHHVLPNAV
ncbi:hypothetical protein DSECCO2_646300 [anaerobic digester metagenome]